MPKHWTQQLCKLPLELSGKPDLRGNICLLVEKIVAYLNRKLHNWVKTSWGTFFMNLIPISGGGHLMPPLGKTSKNQFLNDIFGSKHMFSTPPQLGFKIKKVVHRLLFESCSSVFIWHWENSKCLT